MFVFCVASPGHFTQVVWEGSTELGVGLATDGYITFVVGQYLPAGNMQGQFEQNVHKEGNIWSHVFI